MSPVTILLTLLAVGLPGLIFDLNRSARFRVHPLDLVPEYKKNETYVLRPKHRGKPFSSIQISQIGVS